MPWKNGFNVCCWEVFGCVFLWIRTCHLLPCSLWKKKQDTCRSSLKWTNGRGVVALLAVKHTAPWVIQTCTLKRLTNTAAILLRRHIRVARMKYHVAIFRIIHTTSILCLSPPSPPPHRRSSGGNQRRERERKKETSWNVFVLGGKNKVKNRWMKPGV